VFAFFHQNANAKAEFVYLAKMLEALVADSFGAHQGRSQRESPSALSWFVLCRAAKNEQ